jgi:MoxR-like ATPase
MARVVIGQQGLVDRLLVAVLADGHLLIEGVPGLAKTTAVKALAQAVQAKFQRIQFTPDLLPSDLVGTLVYEPQGGRFVTKKGPIFANFILADEINRAPAKVQSALLEAMAERQVTIGENTFKLDGLFLVMATQNPIEQEGTYPLPEAQLDRFMLKVNVTYPTLEEERLILQRMGTPSRVPAGAPVIQPQQILEARSVLERLQVDEKIARYILDLVFATRYPERYGLQDLGKLIRYGASPRATLYLAAAAKAYALIQGRGYVTPQDVKCIGPDVLRHRIIVTYEADAEEIGADDVIRRILEEIEVP